MSFTEVKLQIADIVIVLESEFPLERLSKEEKNWLLSERFSDFFYAGKKEADIFIKVKVVKKIPSLTSAKNLFTTYHFQDGSQNWRFLKRKDTYIYYCPLEGRKQIMFVNRNFNKVRAYLLAKDNKKFSWNVNDIIYDFLQVLLINYFAQRKSAIFAHAMGIKDLDKKGILFAGKSGSGKSTLAKLWHKYSNALILNDDRIIVVKKENKFFIYGSPWHGDFNDYLSSCRDSALLNKIFFIHHSRKNEVRKISFFEAWKLLYPVVFPTFWDKRGLNNIVSFCQDLVNNVETLDLGFVKNRNIIPYIRKLLKKL